MIERLDNKKQNKTSGLRERSNTRTDEFCVPYPKKKKTLRSLFNACNLQSALYMSILVDA